MDPTINAAKMEMYADVDSRGGILEPHPRIEGVLLNAADACKRHVLELGGGAATLARGGEAARGGAARRSRGFFAAQRVC